MTTKVRHILTSLQLACLPEDEPMATNEGYWWLGFDGKQSAAFCSSRPSSQWEDAMYMSRCGVLPAWRGKGLQRKMLSIRERHARKLGYTWSITDTTENPASANNLIRNKYKIIEPSSPWGLNEQTIYWTKCLTKTPK